MKRISIALLMLLIGFGCTQHVNSAEEGSAVQLKAMDQLEAFEADNSDADPLVQFANENFEVLIKQMQESPKEAKPRIDQFRKTMEELKIKDNPAAENMVQQILNALDSFSIRIAAAETTLDEVKAKLEKDPSDVDAVKLYTLKLTMVFMEDMMDDVDKAESFLASQKKFVAATLEKTDDSDAKLAYKRAEMTIRQMGGNIEQMKALQAVVGKEMLPIEADAWVNGDAQTIDKLKGKVVLLDFWAIWCGPCIRGFPHLVEWQEKYGKDGFQVVGVTEYFGFEWPEGAEGPQQAQGGNDPEREQDALTKLTKKHELKHPTAVLSEPEELNTYYAVSAIPHMVLIGRDGKVRKVQAGINEAIAKSIDEKIQELLKEPAPSSK
ncbi:redoxin family protein [Blastopirellula marina]|uniref:Thioredoxin domain-containing protein n=1 Tax=Blastopirellula marina TaxID=124 RepID=A0A2S8GKB6_9BACT|nr:redoxin family protein [Blastopirellula marina]PQO44887.1 hypothetical protein C5Y93_17505 [Blastopirellula marina]